MCVSLFCVALSDQPVIKMKFPRPSLRPLPPRIVSQAYLVISPFSPSSFYSSALCYVVSLEHTLPVSGKLAIANVIKEKAFVLTAMNRCCWTCWFSRPPSSTYFPCLWSTAPVSFHSAEQLNNLRAQRFFLLYCSAIKPVKPVIVDSYSLP